MLPTKESAAAASPPRLWRGKRLDQVGGFTERLGVERVVHPATLAAIGHQPSLLEDPEVKGESRLRGVEVIGEFADAALASAQALEYLERVSSDSA
jgi:hypothetical protein